MGEKEDAQTRLKPYLIEWLRQDGQGPVIGMRYIYRGKFGKHRYRARARHITEQGGEVPALPLDEGKGNQRAGNPSHIIDPDKAGWAYAEPLDLDTKQ